MAIFRFKNFIPNIDKTSYIAPGAHCIGNIVLGQNSSVWHNCVLRGDVNQICIGSNSNVQDLSMLHVTEKYGLFVGENVTIGHSVTLHGCKIGNNALIGMGATILDRTEIGDYCIVAAGSVVAPGKIFPPKKMIMGVPAKVVRDLTSDEIGMLDLHYKSYVGYAKEFKDPKIVEQL